MFCQASIDWAATGSMFQAFATLLGAIAVFWAARVGADTYGSWLRQKQTERKIAVGEELLTIVYTSVDVFRSIRSAASFGHEHNAARDALVAAIPDFGARPEGERHRLEMAQVVLTRVQDNADLWRRFFAILPATRAFFGLEMQENVRAIWRLRGRVVAAAQRYGDRRGGGDQPTDARVEEDIWQVHHDDRDGFERELTALIASLEAVILPLISADRLEVGV